MHFICPSRTQVLCRQKGLLKKGGKDFWYTLCFRYRSDDRTAVGLSSCHAAKSIDGHTVLYDCDTRGVTAAIDAAVGEADESEAIH